MIRAVALALAVALAAAACGSRERAPAVAPSADASVAVAPVEPAAAAPPVARLRGKVFIRPDAVWVVGAGGGQRVLPCDAGGLDTAAVVAALCALQGERGAPAVDLAAAASVPGEHLVALDAALRELGVRDVAALTPETLGLMVRGDAASLPVVAARCGQRPDPCPALARGAALGDAPSRAGAPPHATP